MSRSARRWRGGREPARWVFSALMAALLGLGCAGEASAAPKGTSEVRFATVDGTPLLLDVYRPENGARPLGLIVWVHGGAWRAGSRASPDLLGLTARGWALASVDYRLSTVARFPAQVFDIKAALRHLRAHAAEYGVAGLPFVIAGSSAGGHLAALVGVSNGERDLEGSVGSEREVSSDVQAIVSLYGASNLTSILGQSSWICCSAGSPTRSPPWRGWRVRCFTWTPAIPRSCCFTVIETIRCPSSSRASSRPPIRSWGCRCS